MQSQVSISHQLCTVRDYIRWAVSEFTRANVYFGHGTENAFYEAQALVLHAVNVPMGCHELLLDSVLTLHEREQVLVLIKQRVEQRLPLPYLTGEAWFAGLAFFVDKRVLIPRSPIAELIERGFSPWLGEQPVEHILDLCTGGGCIGIACAHYFEEALVDLSDLSHDALAVADINIERYELQHRVQTVQSDLFDALEGRQYQLIVSNPPYVDCDDLASMPEEFHHEPGLALASGDDGLDLTRRLLKTARQYLAEDGVLVVEVGNSGLALERAYPDVAFTWVEFEHGGHGVFVFTKAELDRYAQSLT
jgi:ribosomal protein L3 glutamine methyltransferase